MLAASNYLRQIELVTVLVGCWQIFLELENPNTRRAGRAAYFTLFGDLQIYERQDSVSVVSSVPSSAICSVVEIAISE